MYVFNARKVEMQLLTCEGVPEDPFSQEGILILDKAGDTEYVKGHRVSGTQGPSAVNFPECF
jgi:hypothetical protein